MAIEEEQYFRPLSKVDRIAAQYLLDEAEIEHRVDEAGDIVMDLDDTDEAAELFDAEQVAIRSI